MRIELKKFGNMLISRPAGREAFLVMQSSLIKDLDENELIKIDFSGVEVLTPSWADEVITPVTKKYNNVKLLNTNNESVKASLETLRQYSGLKIDRIIKREIPSKILPSKRDSKTGRFAANNSGDSFAYPTEYIVIGRKE